MARFRQLITLAAKLDTVFKEESESHFLIRELIDLFSLFFVIGLSHLLSFQWFRLFLRRLPLTTYDFTLYYAELSPYPFNIETYRWVCKVRGGTDGNRFDDPRLRLSDIGLSRYYTKINYEANILEIPFVIIHWMLSHVCKILSYLIAFPFAAVAFGIKAVGYTCLKAYHNFNLQKKSAELDSHALASKWSYRASAEIFKRRFFESSQNWAIADLEPRLESVTYREHYLMGLYVTPLVAKLTAQQVLDGIFTAISSDAVSINPDPEGIPYSYTDHLCQSNSRSASYVKLCWEEYASARIQHLKTQRQWALVKTIMSGLFILPLLFTIKNYTNLVISNKKEIQELDAIQSDFQERKDIRLVLGQRYLNQNNLANAHCLFNAIPPSSKEFEESKSKLEDLGYTCLANGSYQNAMALFAASNNQRAHFIATKLAANPNATLGDFTAIESEAPCSLFQSNGLFPSSANRVRSARQDDEIRGLDEDDDFSAPLLAQ